MHYILKSNFLIVLICDRRMDAHVWSHAVAANYCLNGNIADEIK